jgi:hypothetical protein
MGNYVKYGEIRKNMGKYGGKAIGSAISQFCHFDGWDRNHQFTWRVYDIALLKLRSCAKIKFLLEKYEHGLVTNCQVINTFEMTPLGVDAHPLLHSRAPYANSVS